MQKLLAILFICVILFSSLSCDNVKRVLTPKPEPTIKIGFIVAGQRVTYPNGAEMAVTEINQQGGLFGMPVELIGHINSEAVLDDSVQLAESLIVDDGVVALIGPNRSSHAAVVGPVAQKHRIPMVTTTGYKSQRNASWRFCVHGILHGQFSRCCYGAICENGTRY